MASIEQFLGWWPMLLGLQALVLMLVGVSFLANKKRAQRRLAEWVHIHGADGAAVTDPQNGPARAMIAATTVDHQRHSGRTSTDDSGDSGGSDGGSDGGGGGD